MDGTNWCICFNSVLHCPTDHYVLASTLNHGMESLQGLLTQMGYYHHDVSPADRLECCIWVFFQILWCTVLMFFLCSLGLGFCSLIKAQHLCWCLGASSFCLCLFASAFSTSVIRFGTVSAAIHSAFFFHSACFSTLVSSTLGSQSKSSNTAWCVTSVL